MGKIALLLVILLLSGVSVLGCAQTGAQPRGWSGGTIVNDTMFLGSMDGKLVAVNTLSGSYLWGVPLDAPPPAGGGFGCAASSSSVAIYGSPAVDGDLVFIAYSRETYTLAGVWRDFMNRVRQDIPFFTFYGILLLVVSGLLVVSLVRRHTSDIRVRSQQSSDQQG